MASDILESKVADCWYKAQHISHPKIELKDSKSTCITISEIKCIPFDIIFRIMKTFKNE